MSDERKYICPDCRVKSAYWNVELGVGYCFTCLSGKFEDPFDSFRAPERPKIRQKRPEKAKIDPDQLFSEIMESDWKIPLKDQKRLIKDRKMDVCQDYTVSFRCEGESLTQNRSLFRSQKGWRMQFSQEDNRETTVFVPFSAPKSEESGCLVLCEGILDSIRIAQAVDWAGPIYPVAVLGTNIGPTGLFHLMGKREEWPICRTFTWMDPDRAGLMSNKKIRRQLPRYLFPSVTPIFTKLEPADMSVEEVRVVIKECISSE